MTTDTLNLPQIGTTQHIVDVAMRHAERWLKADAERRANRLLPSDYEPAAADLSSYLHTAIKDFARTYANAAVQRDRERLLALAEIKGWGMRDDSPFDEAIRGLHWELDRAIRGSSPASQGEGE